MNIRKLLAALGAVFFMASAALAQTPGTVTNHAFVIGKGAGQTGYTSLLCGSAQLAVGQSAADPICRTITGDVTITAGGVTAIGAGKVLGSMLGSMTSAELRAALSDETGTGIAYFVGGALGTPSSATLTNATGLPVGGIAAVSAYTLLGNFTGSSAVPTATAPPSLTHKASPATTDLLIVVDAAASNAIKQATIAEVIGSIGTGVTTYNSRSGAVTPVASDYASLAGMGATWNYGISTSVAANALTVTLTDAAGSTPSSTSPSVASFRSATLTTGTVTARSTTSSQSITAASGASFGSTNNTPFNLLVAEFDDAGTKRVGLMNASESGIIHPVGAHGRASSTAISSSATSAGVWYTGTAVTDKPYVLIGRISWTATPLATAGTYANGPDVVTLVGPGFKFPGDVVQQKTTGDGAFKAGGTTLIPHDNTIPQITEGQEFYTRSITPTSQANWLVIRSRLYLSATAASFLTAAIFQDATANALAVADDTDLSGNLMKRLDIEFTMLANTVSSTTFRLRGGGNNAATFSANGASGAGFFNGTLYSFISVTEIQG